MSLVVRPAVKADLPSIQALLTSAGLPVPSAEDLPVEFVVAEDQGTIAACAGWERYGEHALLRSVATRPDVRGRRVGHQVVDRALAEIGKRGVREVTLVTLSAEGFFRGLGFANVPRAEVAKPVQASPEYSAHCCGEGTWMRLRIGNKQAQPGPI